MKSVRVKNNLKKVLCAVFSVVMIFSLSACMGEGEPGKEDYKGASTGTTVETKQDNTFDVNETAVFENLKITATEVKESTGEDFFKPESGNVFVGVKFTIENTSDEEQTISSILLFDAYADDVSCNYSISALAAFGSETLDGSLAPGKKLIGWYAVEVPQDWAKLELNVKANWLSDASATFVFENTAA